MQKTVNVLGIMINDLTNQEFEKKITKILSSKQKVKIFTPNPEILLKARKNNTHFKILSSADILLADGIGVVWASRLLGEPISQRITGIDAAEMILKICNKQGYSLFLLGGKEGVAKQAKINLKAKYKNIKICGAHHGYFDIDGKDNEIIVSQIQKLAPDVIFVCMGFPRQERWICQNSDKIPSLKLSMGLGGSLDVWSGNIKRAPFLFRKLCLEWLWRMLLEPHRFKTLFEIPFFFTHIFLQRLNNNDNLLKYNGKNDH